MLCAAFSSVQGDPVKQTTFASVAYDRKGKVTRRERFLSEMDQVIPWGSILGLIEPHYPKAGNGTQPMPMERMLRIYFMQQWFNLSDPAMEDSPYARSRCAASRRSSCRTIRCPMSRRSCAFATCSSSTS
jgi:hypothetical protein